MSAVATTTINELIIENHRLTEYPVCIHQDDSMEWYDRIIRGHAILNSRKFGIPDNGCKLHIITNNLLKFRTQINNTISKQSYSSSKKLTHHCVGQGVAKLRHSLDVHKYSNDGGCRGSISSLHNYFTLGENNGKKLMLGFLNDKRHYVNCTPPTPQQINRQLLTVIDLSVSLWKKILHCVGGVL